MLKLLADYQTKFKIRTFDISDKPDMAKVQRMFFPTLTVVNGRRYFSPIKCFPNGYKEFFERNGYSDDGVISVEQGYCELHLMSKEL